MAITDTTLEFLITRTITPYTTLEFPCERTITPYTTLEFPCERIIEKQEYTTLEFPCERVVKKEEYDETINADVLVEEFYITNFILQRNVEKAYTINADLQRKIPYNITFKKHIPQNTEKLDGNKTIHLKQNPKSNYISIQISLSEQTLQDKFKLITTQPININEALKGKILDFGYSFLADNLSWTGIERTVQGMYDVDKILYSKFKFNQTKSWEGYGSLGSWANKIANALGKKLNYHCDDFSLDNTFSSFNGTYSSCIGSLFGWSSAIPHKIINVFLRANDNSLNIVQRGHETNVIDLTNTHHSYPQYQQEIMRTVTAVNDVNNDINSVSSGTTGKYPWSEWVVPPGPNGEYVYPAGAVKQDGLNGESPAFKLRKENGYPTEQTIYHPDGARTEKQYIYGDNGDNTHSWGKEIECTYDSNGNMSQTVIEHLSLGGDWYSHTRYDDGEYVGSSISQGVAIAEVGAPEMISAKLVIHLYDKNSNTDKELQKALNIPTDNMNIIDRYKNEVLWLDRKTKETVTFDLYKYNHVVDFTDKIVFKGNEYYLVSNNISYDLKEHKQQLTLVRWF